MDHGSPQDEPLSPFGSSADSLDHHHLDHLDHSDRHDRPEHFADHDHGHDYDHDHDHGHDYDHDHDHGHDYDHDHDPSHLSPRSPRSRQHHPPCPDRLPDPRSHYEYVPDPRGSPADVDAPTHDPQAPDDVDPAEFYRSYQGVQQRGTAEGGAGCAGDASPPAKDPMAPAVIGSSRQPPSLRSNGNGTTPKHAAAPLSHRSTPRPGRRSLSSPVDGRSGTIGTGGAQRPAATADGRRGMAGGTPPNARNTQKKLDQSTSPSPTGSRKTIPRASTGANGNSPGVGSDAASQGAPRTSAAREPGRDPGRRSGARSAQRPKPAAEDPGPGTSHSFASRISKPRLAGSATAKPSKSTAQPGPHRQKDLLFGEILPEQHDSVTPGFGIESARPRRTSESNLADSLRRQTRTLSDPDVEPPSPTDWYRAAALPTAQQSTDRSASNVPRSQHSRAHSDLAGFRLALARPGDGAGGPGAESPVPATSPTSPTSPTSRLPRLARRVNDASSHGSPVSTRSSSPSTSGRQSVSSGSTSRQHGPLASGARRTSTTSSAPRPSSKLPGSARKTPPSSLPTAQPSSRLNAYVSIPPPKLSPTLRSSRPRQSVATATTAASRMRAVETALSPRRQPLRPPSRGVDLTSQRPRPSVGAIDFAQRRESIKLAYNKSIRESQAREARQAAVEERMRELAAVAGARAETEGAADVAADAGPTPPGTAGEGDREATAEQEVPEIEQQQAETGASAEESHALRDPLRLEIPGSFPGGRSPPLDGSDGIPCSAVSTTSAVTEFDTEVQTDSPRQEIPGPESTDGAPGVATAPSLAEARSLSGVAEQPPEQTPVAPAVHKRASYRSPFDEGDEQDSVSIRISLDQSPPPPMPQASPEVTPTRSTFESQPEEEAPPAAPPVEEDDDDDDEYVPRPYMFSDPYKTTVTILGPEPDFGPSHREPPHAATPQAGVLREDDEPPAPGTPSIAVSEASQTGGARFGEAQIEIEKLERIEDFYTGPRLCDNIAALRDSALASSDPGTPFEAPPASAEYQRLSDAPHALAVRGLLVPGNRSSQHSAWTDFSFCSEDRDAGHPSPASQSHAADFHDDATPFRAVPSTGGLSPCASSVGELVPSPESPALERPGTSSFSTIPELPTAHQQRLPEPAGTGSFTPLSNGSDRGGIAPLPVRDPPRPPASEHERERRGASALAPSRPGSYVYSQEGDLREPLPSPRSLSHFPIDPEPSRSSLGEAPSEDGQASLTEKEREEQRRLRQRQLVIRELIDTEDAFVRDMTVVEEIYKGTAEACPNLDSKTVKLIFRNTDEIIAFHTALLLEFKEGAATVYTPKGRRSPHPMPDGKEFDPTGADPSSFSANRPEKNDEKDRLTAIGPVFLKNIEQLKAVHEIYLRSSDSSAKRLMQIQEDETVMLWLNECNEVAKELTSAWNLDSLLIKPMQRITKYPDIIAHLLKYTPEDHPDRESLVQARAQVIETIDEINKTKKNFELVGQIVSNRKRKESDVRGGIARAFGKRVDKLQVSAATKPVEDSEYQKLEQQFGDDYLRLQVVLRDVDFYIKSVVAYVHEFLQYLSSMELVMRLQPSRDYAHLESKWVQFNVSMRDIEKIALERHLADVRKHVVEPFEQVIRCYGNPALAMKKRAKRRLDYEKYVVLKANGKKVDKQLAELVEQYEALNDTLKKELPKLSAMTAKIGNICLGKFISIQASWFAIWKEKVRAPLSDVTHVPEISEIVSTFQREFALQEERARALSIINPALRCKGSQSTTDDSSSVRSKTRPRPGDIVPPRSRGLSINSDQAPVLPTPDFTKRNSGQFSLSPASSALPSPANYYRDYYSSMINNNNNHNNGGNTAAGSARGGGGSASPVTPAESTGTPRPGMGVGAGLPPTRPSTGRSYDSTSLPRQSSESAPAMSMSNRRDSISTFGSSYPAYSAAGEQQQQQTQTRRLSGLFSSALPMPDAAEERSARSSRASSRDRGGATGGGRGYKVLWLAASLFEFNIEETKHEAGYPYLTYQAGEIFDVIAEKGELWLAKNQDDPRDVVGWIWSKHFAKLADS
ncbi:hypothetical protein VTH06DRAFT_443 [Thermothelomyces fergusii]